MEGIESHCAPHASAGFGITGLSRAARAKQLTTERRHEWDRLGLDIDTGL
jgi:hypothetical protein